MAISNITDLALGNLLQTIFTNGVRVQISQDFRDFEMVKRMKSGSSVARDLKFMLQKSFGPAAIQPRSPGVTNRAFPSPQQSSIQEGTAIFKEIEATIELEYSMYDRARKSPEKYGEPLALEMAAKATAGKRYIAARLYDDGTGVVGTVASAALTSPASNQLVFSLSSANAARGSVGMFEYDDLLVLKSAAGGTSALDTNLGTEPAAWKVIAKNRRAGTVTLQGLDSNLSPVATISSISVQPTAGDVFYRIGQATIPNLSSVGDYGTASESLAGLESLTANDGRLLHGITMSGSTGGTHEDAGANPIDVKHLQQVMDQVKVAVGQDRYRWKMAVMSPETQAAFIESRETDRRFVSAADNKRGVKSFSYIHGNDELELYTSEFCSQKRIYVLPETKAGEKVIEFHGADWETIKDPMGNSFHLKPGSSGGYLSMVQSFLKSTGVFIATHSAAIGVVENFTNS